MFSDLRKGIGDESDATARGDAQPRIPVLPLGEVAEPTDGFELRSAHKDTCRIQHHVAHDESIEYPPGRRFRGMHDALDLHALVTRIRMTAHERDLRMCPEVRDLAFDLVGEPDVVRIEE